MLRLIGTAFVRLTGWRIAGERPTAPKFVLIAAPHTSNWDLIYLLSMARMFDIRMSWMGKKAIFRPPFGTIMKWFGGIPIVRSRSENMVQQMARRFRERDALALVVPAEGTRGHVDYWKSGFYHIAHAAGVPIVMGFLDYDKRRGGFGPALHTTGDIARDMDRIRDFYQGMTGKYPKQFGRIRLKEEDQVEVAAGSS